MASMKIKVLEWLMNGEKSTIVNLSEQLGSSVPTINKCLQSLIDDGFVIELGTEAAPRGRRPMIYAINPDACCFIGIDVKHYTVMLMATSLSGKVMATRKVDEGYEFSNTPAGMHRICAEVLKFISDFDLGGSVRMVSFNISGRVNARTGYSYSIFNFEGADTPLTTTLSDKIGYPVVIENDTRAMAYGEFVAGRLGKYRNALFINFSYGLGMSMIIDGKIYTGADGYSGEIGHIYSYENNIICHCGKKGCLETELSMSAVARKIKAEILAGKSSSLEDVARNGVITPNIIAAAVNEGDPLAMEVVENAGKELGREIANFINIFNPEAVVIGGAMALCSDYFLMSTKQAIFKYALRLMCSRVSIDLSELMETSGALGACMNARARYIESIDTE